MGALTRCQHCGYEPDTDQSKSAHILTTEHYHSLEELNAIGAQVKAGEPLQFDPNDYANRLIARDARKSMGEQMRDWYRRALLVLLVVIVIVCLRWCISA
jgi:hypothetical protein